MHDLNPLASADPAPMIGPPCGALLRDAGAIVDVRTPAEYAQGAIAGAVNIPLFADAERAEIGTLYKQVGRNEAIARGLDFAGGRLREFVQRFEPYRGRRVLVYCARGGMRSASVVSLLASLGYSVTRLPGGYKAFRKYLLGELECQVPPHVIVIHGQTGVGKTPILRRLDNSLDLEDQAQHRSSLFGGVNRRPRTQQQFEANLLHRLLELDFSRPVWIEGESRKVGPVTIPSELMGAMRGGTMVLLTASVPTRVRRIIAEYDGDDPDTLPQLESALLSLNHLFGNDRTRDLAARLRAGHMEEVVETLLVDYYDPRYAHAMRNYRYALTLSAEDPDACAAALRAFAGQEAGRAHPPAQHAV
jgi:tRNA 2-selenouridine synthase